MLYGDRKVYTVSAFNRGISRFLGRLPAVWVEGEVTELRRNAAWATVFLTLKDPKTGASLKVTIARTTYDRLELGLDEGETSSRSGASGAVRAKGELGLRASTLERIGVGGHLVALERLKRELAAEGLFAPERKRRLPRVPRAIGVLTGADAAARGDLLTTIGRRFPADQGDRLRDARPGARRARGDRHRPARARGASGGRRRRSRARRWELRGPAAVQHEAVIRAVATCAVPVVSAVGHEQDTPLCDLAADARAATPTAAAALVVPDVRELHAALETCRHRLDRSVRNLLAHDVTRIERLSDRLSTLRGSFWSAGVPLSITAPPGSTRSRRSRRSPAGTPSSGPAARRCGRLRPCRPGTGSRSSSP